MRGSSVKARPTRTVLPILLTVLGSLNSHQVSMLAPPGSTLGLNANPGCIAANGDVSLITAIVTEPAGTPVADGTVVQ
jgi:hypothetical protein